MWSKRLRNLAVLSLLPFSVTSISVRASTLEASHQICLKQNEHCSWQTWKYHENTTRQSQTWCLGCTKRNDSLMAHWKVWVQTQVFLCKSAYARDQNFHRAFHCFSCDVVKASKVWMKYPLPVTPLGLVWAARHVSSQPQGQRQSDQVTVQVAVIHLSESILPPQHETLQVSTLQWHCNGPCLNQWCYLFVFLTSPLSTTSILPMRISMSIAFSDKVIGMSPLLSGISLLLVCHVSVSYLLPSVLANQAPGKFPRHLLSPSWACLKLKLPIPAVQNKGTVLRSFKKRCSKNQLWWPARSVAINSYGVCKAILLHTYHT